MTPLDDRTGSTRIQCSSPPRHDESTRGAEATLIAPVPEPSTSAEPVSERTQAPRKTPYRGRRIRVVLVDDHAVVRSGLMLAFEDEPDLEVVGQAADGWLALEVVRQLRPDVVLMDIGLPTIDGIETTRLIAVELRDVRVIGLTMFDDEWHRAAMRQAGAVECLDKTAPIAGVVDAIRRHGGGPGRRARTTIRPSVL